MLDYTCPICNGHKFRDTNASYIAIVDNAKRFVFEHECYNSGCDGVLYVSCDLKFEDRKIIKEEDIQCKI